jgi:integrase
MRERPRRRRESSDQGMDQGRQGNCERGPVEVVKYASDHDLRRSFVERWASRLMPKDLMVLMRHENFNPTLKYYAGRNAETTADAAWAAYEAAKGNQQSQKAGTNADYSPAMAGR